jgi:hypothetical protein
MRKEPKDAASHATSSIHATIDCILDRGAEKLYDRYITGKLPSHLSGHLQSTTHSLFSFLEQP